MAAVAYVNASCIYPGATTPAVDSLDLEIRDGEFMVLVGPSGSGKSTALRMLAGLEEVSRGAIYLDGNDISKRPPKERDVAMVFQNYALYPHMSVAENMGFALKLKGITAEERTARVREAADLLDLTPYLDRLPGALSGGQRQRVAMGRAIVRSPAVFLMDEPLSNLDAKLRTDTRATIAKLQAQLGTTTLYVTLDQAEAMEMGHRVAVLKDGVLQQVGTPADLLSRPANVFVAGYLGSPPMNLRTVELVPGGAQLGNLALPLSNAVEQAADGRQLTLGIRPESFALSGPEDGARPDSEPGSATGLKIDVKLVEQRGTDTYLYGELVGDRIGAAPYVVRFDGPVSPRVGDVVSMDVRVDEVHAFHPQTGERLG